VNEERIEGCVPRNRSGTRNSGKTLDECRVVARGGTFASKGSCVDKGLEEEHTAEAKGNEVNREKRNWSRNNGCLTRFSSFSFASTGTMRLSSVLVVPQNPSG
jgi:hypothetical protein